MKLLHDLSLDELKRELEQIVEKMPRFRAQQIFDWATLYAPFDEMTNIPQELRETLKHRWLFVCLGKERTLGYRCSIRTWLPS